MFLTCTLSIQAFTSVTGFLWAILLLLCFGPLGFTSDLGTSTQSDAQSYFLKRYYVALKKQATKLLLTKINEPNVHSWDCSHTNWTFNQIKYWRKTMILMPPVAAVLQTVPWTSWNASWSCRGSKQWNWPSSLLYVNTTCTQVFRLSFLLSKRTSSSYSEACFYFLSFFVTVCHLFALPLICKDL